MHHVIYLRYADFAGIFLCNIKLEELRFLSPCWGRQVGEEVRLFVVLGVIFASDPF
jgi:hypothetical protein